jgi:hypothetical protein
VASFSGPETGGITRKDWDCREVERLVGNDKDAVGEVDGGAQWEARVAQIKGNSNYKIQGRPYSREKRGAVGCQ